jgi:hypothetical protein
MDIVRGLVGICRRPSSLYFIHVSTVRDNLHENIFFLKNEMLCFNWRDRQENKNQVRNGSKYTGHVWRYLSAARHA